MLKSWRLMRTWLGRIGLSFVESWDKQGLIQFLYQFPSNKWSPTAQSKRFDEMNYGNRKQLIAAARKLGTQNYTMEESVDSPINWYHFHFYIVDRSWTEDDKDKSSNCRLSAKFKVNSIRIMDKLPGIILIHKHLILWTQRNQGLTLENERLTFGKRVGATGIPTDQLVKQWREGWGCKYLRTHCSRKRWVDCD